MEETLVREVLRNSIRYQNDIHPDIKGSLAHLRIDPYPHQLQMIQSMVCHKTQMTHGFYHENEYIHGKVGIVADPPGTGKALSVLGYLGLQESSFPFDGELNTASNRLFTSYTMRSRRDCSAINVIIVPPTLLQQWQHEIEQHTRLRAFVIGNRRVLRNSTTYASLLASDLILTTSRVWKDVYTYTQQNRIVWKNLCIDEATSIYFSPNDGIPTFDFLWLITSNWLSLQFRNQQLNLQSVSDLSQNTTYYCSTESSSFYRQLIPWNHPYRHLLVLRTGGQYPYPSLQTEQIQCRQHYTLLNLPPSILGTNYSGLTHERMPMIMGALNMTALTTDRMKALYGKSDLIDSKVADDCSICLEQPEHKVMLPCCMNVFCAACILRQLIMSGQCPTCRNSLALTNLHPLLTTDASMNTFLQLTKQETCLQYIRQACDSSSSFLIYTTYENTYYQMQSKFEEIGISCDYLDSSLPRFIKTVANFNNGNTKVLFISNIDLIRGLTLKATHLLLFYAVPSYEREQILIHSMQRVGSLGPKQVVQLVAALDS